MKLPIKIKSFKYYQILLRIYIFKINIFIWRNKYSPYIMSFFSIIFFFYSIYKFLMIALEYNWINIENSWIIINSSLLQSNTALIAIYLVVATIFLPYINYEKDQLHSQIDKLKEKEKSKIQSINEVPIDMINILDTFDKFFDKLMENEPKLIYKNLKISSISILTIIILSIIGLTIKLSMQYSIYYLSFIFSLQLLVVSDIYHILSIYFENSLLTKSKNNNL